MINVDLWKKINKMLQSSDRKIELFQCDEVRGINIIKEIGLNNTTTLSTIIANCAGVIVDDCIRILGQGDVNVHGIYEVNLIENGSAIRVMGMLLVAFDIFGGLFAMNMGAINDAVSYTHLTTIKWIIKETKLGINEKILIYVNSKNFTVETLMEGFEIMSKYLVENVSSDKIVYIKNKKDDVL